MVSIAVMLRAFCLVLVACGGELAAADGGSADAVGSDATGSACATYDRVRLEKAFLNPPACAIGFGERPECVEWSKSFGLSFVLWADCVPQDGGARCKLHEPYALSAAAPTLCPATSNDDPTCRRLLDSYLIDTHVDFAPCGGYMPPPGKFECNVAPQVMQCPAQCPLFGKLPDGGITPQFCVGRTGMPKQQCEPFCTSP